MFKRLRSCADIEFEHAILIGLRNKLKQAFEDHLIRHDGSIFFQIKLPSAELKIKLGVVGAALEFFKGSESSAPGLRGHPPMEFK